MGAYSVGAYSVGDYNVGDYSGGGYSVGDYSSDYQISAPAIRVLARAGTPIMSMSRTYT